MKSIAYEGDSAFSPNWNNTAGPMDQVTLRFPLEALTGVEPGPKEDGYAIVSGTQIETWYGERPIENLRPGDLLRTLDWGYQPVRSITRRTYTAAQMDAYPHLKPIRFAADTIGNTQPVCFSKKHRVLLRSSHADLYFGEPEVLIQAQSLDDGRKIQETNPVMPVTLYCILFDRHQIIFANGARVESAVPETFLATPCNADICQSLRLQFPDIDACKGQPLARKSLQPHEADLLLQQSA